MAFIGNLEGPKESEVVERLGPEYFGLDREQLQQDIDWYSDSEQRSEVVPVHVDEDGRAYVVFSIAGRTTHRFYPEGSGYELMGEILTYTEEEQRRWQGRGDGGQ